MILALFILKSEVNAGIFDDRQRYSEIPFLMIKMLNLPSSGTPGAAINPPKTSTPTPGIGNTTPTPGAGGQQATVNAQGLTGNAVYEPTASPSYQLQLQFTLPKAVEANQQVNIWLNKGNTFFRGPLLNGPIPVGNRAQGEIRDIVNRIDHTVIISIDPVTLPTGDGTGPSGEIIFQAPQQVTASNPTQNSGTQTNSIPAQKPSLSIFQKLLNSLQNLF